MTEMLICTGFILSVCQVIHPENFTRQITDVIESHRITNTGLLCNYCKLFLSSRGNTNPVGMGLQCPKSIVAEIMKYYYNELNSSRPGGLYRVTAVSYEQPFSGNIGCVIFLLLDETNVMGNYLYFSASGLKFFPHLLMSTSHPHLTSEPVCGVSV